MGYALVGDGPYGLLKIEWQIGTDYPRPPFEVKIDPVGGNGNGNGKYKKIISITNPGTHNAVCDAYWSGKPEEFEAAKQFMLDLAYARCGNV